MVSQAVHFSLRKVFRLGCAESPVRRLRRCSWGEVEGVWESIGEIASTFTEPVGPQPERIRVGAER